MKYKNIFITGSTGVVGKPLLKKLIENGTINGGMIPKVETCVDAVKNGVNAAVILDGRLPHSILLEIFTEHGVGTLISN